MARPKREVPIDLLVTHDLSVGLIERLACPVGVAKAFLRDKDVTGLKVRVTANGSKSFVYEAKLGGKAISKTLGGFPLMTIGEAKDQARSLAKMVKTDKVDPRAFERQQRVFTTTFATSVGEAWAAYLAERQAHWGERHFRDHQTLSARGGEPFKRGSGITQPGPLASLMDLPLRDLTPQVVEAWAANEAKGRATQARLAWRLLKGFLGWCNEHDAYAGLFSGNPAKTKKAREALGKPGVKTDVLQKGQLKAWFAAVQQISNPVIAAYLQIVLLTGARPGEVMTLQWNDLNIRWKGITIRDKVEGERVIPLTPYVARLLVGLPRRNEWVFSSPTSASGYLSEPTYPHTVACKVAGLDGLTLHGLRRSFKSLTEWLEVPTGIVAQIMGHKPSATAEKHYTVRPLELLRLHHEKIEAWVLEQAGISFDVKAEQGASRVDAIGK
jgi:integrase